MATDKEEGNTSPIPRQSWRFQNLPMEIRVYIFQLVIEDAQIVSMEDYHRRLTADGKVYIPACRKRPTALYVNSDFRAEAKRYYTQSFGSQFGFPVYFNSDLDTLLLASSQSASLFYSLTPVRLLTEQPRDNLRFLAIAPIAHRGPLSTPTLVQAACCARLIFRFLPTLEEVVIIKSVEGEWFR